MQLGSRIEKINFIFLKRTFGVLFLFIVSARGYSQCNSDFTHTKDGESLTTIIPGEEVKFYKAVADICVGCTYFLDFGDGNSVSGSGVVLVDGLIGAHTYNEDFEDGASLIVKLKVYSEGCETQSTINFKYKNESCDTCSSFKLEANERYWMSAWVKVGEEQVKTYNPNGNVSGDVIDPLEIEDAYIEFFFSGPNISVYFFPTGDIIDGWQRIVGEFTIPDDATEFDVILLADKDDNTFFDDIRIHPFNASMKSYVYDGETFWLTSELDDNNYATFYEYDQEGGLVRIKKETARGIVTIQETKSSTVKQ